jgi:DNA-directed RNA polymerase subunit H (RpoH/RPB5)
MNENPSYQIYGNLPAFLENRGLAPLAPQDLEKKRDRFIGELTEIGYFRVDARDPATADETVVFILAMGGDFSNSAPQLKKLLFGLENEERAGPLAEVILFVEEAALSKKNIVAVLADYRSEKRRYYSMYSYALLALNIPKVQCIPRHTVLTPEEKKALLDTSRIGVADLPFITSTDPPVVWEGARVGDVVRVDAPSETAGTAVRYYLVRR